jgi:hypothetical protein
MVACGRTKNDRRMELVRLFGLLRSDGIFPSAVTLGQYTRALAEGYSKRSMGTPDEDFSGVEVTESASRDLRVGISRKGTTDMEYALSALDGNIFNLEEAGRKWRQKNNPEKEVGKTGDEPSTGQDSKTSTSERQKKRTTHKPWLPVVFSSSFIPIKQDESNSPELPSITSSSIQLLAIWSRTKACDCTYPARYIICTRIAADILLIQSHSFFLLQHAATFHSKKKSRLDGTYFPEKPTPLVLSVVLDVAQC